jgi:PIN domain nuclease of toxin-antitoxin system
VSDDDIVADASAVLAAIKNEPFRHIDPARIVGATISLVNVCEVLTKLLSAAFTEGEAESAVRALDLRMHAFDEAQAKAAAYLWPVTKPFGLSLGDRACLALALALKKPAVTADRAWGKLDVGAEIVLIR